MRRETDIRGTLAKMVGCDEKIRHLRLLAVDLSSPTLFYAGIAYQSEPSEELVEKYYGMSEKPLIMADFAEWNSEKNVYELRPR